MKSIKKNFFSATCYVGGHSKLLQESAVISRQPELLWYEMSSNGEKSFHFAILPYFMLLYLYITS